MQERAVVAVDDLQKVYASGVQALAGISFDVEPGEVFGLLGPNGAGKSTTIGVLTTTVTPTAGSARVGGHDVVRDAIGVRRSIGVSFQQSVLDQEFSGFENLRLHARLWRMPPAEARARIAYLLDRMGLAARANDGVRTYSGGMRRRLEIARALLASPQVLFLDEPTLGLDPAVRRELWSLIASLRREEGVTTLLTTHYLEEAEGVCDRVAVIHEGRIAAIGAPTALIDELGEVTIEVRVLRDAGPAADALRDLGIAARPPLVAGETVALPMRESPPGLAGMLADLQADGLGVAATTVRATTLSDVYLHLTAATGAHA
jgi:ABC-2 type transport system ATP-binding protein